MKRTALFRKTLQKYYFACKKLSNAELKYKFENHLLFRRHGLRAFFGSGSEEPLKYPS